MTENKSHNYVVAIDGSPSSENAFAYTMQHSKPEDKILLTTGVHNKTITITPDLMKDTAKMKPQMDKLEIENQQQQEKARQLLLKYQEKCSTVYKRQCKIAALPFVGGSSAAGETLCAAAERNHATLVMGSRGLSQIERVLLGSISDYCVRNCNATVTVVKESK